MANQILYDDLNSRILFTKKLGILKQNNQKNLKYIKNMTGTNEKFVHYSFTEFHKLMKPYANQELDSNYYNYFLLI